MATSLRPPERTINVGRLPDGLTISAADDMSWYGQYRREHQSLDCADDVVFGSIEDGNTPSRRTAYRLGRVDIGVRLWLTPAGRRGMP